ncbi:hypothetical protein IHE44_0004677 [Lamprotornis superbus]|uniref:Uncharacterized protein n=1 Tax=Lamprotornis superbus TaxID=245042 RepID=A0A835P1Q8_9PASS|nr:hypothetical protein IHE44_0004677 [Lamprotornis superbus]
MWIWFECSSPRQLWSWNNQTVYATKDNAASTLLVFCGWIWKGSGMRKREKLREKRNRSVDKVVEHSAGV